MTMTNLYGHPDRPYPRNPDGDCFATGMWLPRPKPSLPSMAAAIEPKCPGPTPHPVPGAPTPKPLPPKKLVEGIVPGSQKITLLPVGQHEFEAVPMEALQEGDTFSLPDTLGVHVVKLRVAHFVATADNRVLDTRKYPQVMREKRTAVTLIQALEQAITGKYTLPLFATPEAIAESRQRVLKAVGTELTADEANAILDQNTYARIIRESVLEQESTPCLVLIK